MIDCGAMLEWLRVALVAVAVAAAGIRAIGWLFGWSFAETSFLLLAIAFFVQGIRGRLFD